MLTALAALFLSYKAFIRQKSIENENHFFKYKLEEYQCLIYESTALIDAYYNALEEMGTELESRNPDFDTINKYADDVDNKADLFRLTLQKHCAFISENIVKRLDKFYESLSEEFECLNEETYSQELIDKVWERLEKYEIDIEEINSLMREDLGLAAIDRRLKNRTHANTRTNKSNIL